MINEYAKIIKPEGDDDKIKFIQREYDNYINLYK